MTTLIPPARFDIDSNASDDGDCDFEGYDNGTQTSLDSIRDSLKINCNMKSSYTTWEPREAFRELVQNWRDGIIKSFQLAESDFYVKPKEEKTSGRITEIVYRAVDLDASGEEKCLGYIRFKGRDGEGTIDIVNCNATLEPKHLVQGATSKAGRSDQAGAFGEGLKVALVVLMRDGQNHHVQCRSGGFNWTFNFDKHGILVARLRRMSRARLYRENEQATRQAKRLQSLLPFVAQPQYDVHFIIGERRKGISGSGEPTKRNFVKRAQFEAWTKAALFLHNDGGEEAIIKTHCGGLLVAPQFRGMIYLKGLLLDESTALRSASRTSLPLRFGYNFAFGRTDRDRSSVSSADEEARAILAIWDAALAVRPEMVADLDDMLNSSEPKYADVIGARNYMSASLAVRLKNHLVGGDRAENWCYSNAEKNTNPRLDLIIRGLGRNGIELTRTYWDVLSRYGLFRTAEEEELLRFTTAPHAPVPATDFARRLCRLLSSCLRACPQTNSMCYNFVHAGPLDLQLAFLDDDSAFRIHDRWLSIEGASEELCLRGALADAEILYHAVKSLFSDALDQLPLETFVSADGDENHANLPPERRKKLEKSLAEQRILNYLRIENPTVEAVEGRPELRVTWPVDPQWHASTEIEIQCHRASTCYYLRGYVHIANDASPDLMHCFSSTDNDDYDGNRCPCRASRLSSSIGEHLETDLEGGEHYFFLLVMTPADPGSFVSFSSTNDRCSTRRSPSAPPHPSVLPDASIAGPSQSSQHHHVPTNINNDHNDDIDNKCNNHNDTATRGVRDVIVIDEDAVGPLLRVTDSTSPPDGKYDIGPKLSELDVLSMSRWHAAKIFGNVVDDVVIGIRKEPPVAETPESSRMRKRQRMG